jgi:hypothetical protein
VCRVEVDFNERIISPPGIGIGKAAIGTGGFVRTDKPLTAGTKKGSSIRIFYIAVYHKKCSGQGLGFRAPGLKSSLQLSVNSSQQKNNVLLVDQ